MLEQRVIGQLLALPRPLMVSYGSRYVPR